MSTMTLSELQAENERLKAELALEDARKALMQARIEQIQAIVEKASQESDFDVLDGSVERIVVERDEARAQAARLAEALRAIVGNPPDWPEWKACEQVNREAWALRFGPLRLYGCEECRVEDEDSEARDRLIVENTLGAYAALASTDPAWLNKRKVEELERLVRDHLHVESVKNLNAIWDVEYIPAYEVKRRIAELQRKEG